MKIKKPTLKSMKKVFIATMSMFTASAIALGGALGFEIYENKQNKDYNIKNDVVHSTSEVVEDSEAINDEYTKLQQLRNRKLPTVTKKFDGVPYEVASEQDVLNLSEEFAVAIEDYFKTCGASDWANPYSNEFWPEDIEYMVTAIAFMESSYRTDVVNKYGYAGLTGLDKGSILDTLGNQWLIPRIWGDSVPQVNCNPSEVDVFNGTTCIEYTYYNIGYNLANRLKKDKEFIDVDGSRRSIWQEIEFTEDMQIRLIIASHRFGLTNVVDSVFERNYDKDGKLIPLSYYTHGAYVEGVLDKMVELELEYGSNLNY